MLTRPPGLYVALPGLLLRYQVFPAGAEDSIRGASGTTNLSPHFEGIDVSRTSGSHSQQPGLATEDVLDRTVALAQMGADAHLVAEMAGVLLQDCPKQLSAIRAAVALDDAGL